MEAATLAAEMKRLGEAVATFAAVAAGIRRHLDSQPGHPETDAALLAMADALLEEDAAGFELFVLSDTTRPELYIKETAAYHVLRQRVPAAEPSLTAEYVAYVSALPEGSAKQNGLAAGTEAWPPFLPPRTCTGTAFCTRPPGRRVSRPVWAPRRWPSPRR